MLLFLYRMIFELIEIFWGGLFITLRLCYRLAYLFSPRPLGLVSPRYDALSTTPILLVHGLSLDEVCLWPLKMRLIRDGYDLVFLYNLGSFDRTIEEHADGLEKAIHFLYRKYGKIHIVGHSMGGLITRYVIQELGGENKILSLTTFATPHFGSPMANLAISVSGQQLKPQSPVFQKINAPEKLKKYYQENNEQIRYQFLYSPIDILVPPPWGGPLSPFIPSEYYKKLDYVSHTTFLIFKKPYLHVLDLLQEISPTRDVDVQPVIQ